MLDENGRPMLYCEKCRKFPSTSTIDKNCNPYCPDCDSPLTRARYIEPSGAAGEPLIKVKEKTTERTLGIAAIDDKTGKKVYLTSGQIAREHGEP